MGREKSSNDSVPPARLRASFRSRIESSQPLEIGAHTLYRRLTAPFASEFAKGGLYFCQRPRPTFASPRILTNTF